MLTSKEKWRKFKIVLLILLGVLVIGTPIFAYFRISTEGRLALREAKNVKLHLQMLDVELYASQKTVFDSGRPSGLCEEALTRLRDFMEEDFDIRVTSYSTKLRQVTGFVYTKGRYQVLYTYDANKGDTWKVNYVFNIFDYDGE